MCLARIFKPARPLFGFSCSFPFTNVVSSVVLHFRCVERALYTELWRMSSTKLLQRRFLAHKIIAFSLRDPL